MRGRRPGPVCAGPFSFYGLVIRNHGLAEALA